MVQSVYRSVGKLQSQLSDPAWMAQQKRGRGFRFMRFKSAQLNVFNLKVVQYIKALHKAAAIQRRRRPTLTYNR